jgi:hypothetical protein
MISTVVLFAPAPSVAADSGQATVSRFITDGIAQSAFGGCDFLIPPGPLTCHETAVQVFREGASGSPGSTAPPKTPWVITIDDYTVSFVTGGQDAMPVFSDERSGFLLNPTVAFDQQHLSFLSVDARVPMNDGSSFEFQATWSATSARMQFGNDGPSLDEFGLVRHSVDSCNTVNDQAHQKIRLADMVGTLNGAPVQSYPDIDIDFLAHNHFVLIEVAHGNC